MDLFNAWGIRHAGLFTFAQSPKHIGLYQKFGFHARFLTAVMTKPVTASRTPNDLFRYSALTEAQQAEVLRACRDLTESIWGGLDLEREIRDVQQHNLGETLLLWDDSQLIGLAVCHYGPGTEGGDQCCYIKFAAVNPGPDAGTKFEELLDASETLATTQHLPCIEGGVSLPREDAYNRMLAHSFRIMILGVAMHKPNEPGYHREGMYVVDDWR